MRLKELVKKIRSKNAGPFLLTIDKEHNYIFYVGIDKDDRIFDNETQKREITRFSIVFPNIEFKFITMENIPKGYVTLMWNKLFEDAYNLGCDYFYQCGDDIEFKTKGWINDGIKVLEFLLLVIDKSLNTTSVPVDPKQTHCVSKYIPSILPSSKSTIRNENKINLIF